MQRRTALFHLIATALGAVAGPVRAHQPSRTQLPPRALAADWGPPPLPPGVSELRFGELLRLPVGAAGLAPSERLIALVGTPVRLVGHMAATAQPMPGRLILTPLPVDLGEADEALADDLPPTAVFVHLSGPAAQRPIPNYRGLIALVGRIEIGPREEPDGHVSSLRLMLDAETSAACLPDALSGAQSAWR